MSLLIGFQFEVYQINWLKIFRMRVGMNSIQAGEVAKISNATTNPWLDQFVSKVEEKIAT
jgi:hypothetical protein